MLKRLAEKARNQPSPPGKGKYHYHRWQEWNLVESVTTDMKPIGVKLEERSGEDWLADDGSGRIEMDETVRGETLPLNDVFGPDVPAPQRLTGSAAEVRRQLLEAGTERTTGDWFKLVGDTWRRQTVSPELQGLLWDILSEQRYVSNKGTTVDRVGREGIAVSTDSLPTDPRVPAMRSVLIFDSDTGMLLDSEVIALDPGRFEISTPATISYIAFLESGFTPDTESRPYLIQSKAPCRRRPYSTSWAEWLRGVRNARSSRYHSRWD